MSLVVYAVWVSIALIGFTILVNLLPLATDHPYPTEITTAIQTVYEYMSALNGILPLDTMLQILTLSIGLRFTVRVVYPAIMWLIGLIIKSNP